MASSVMVRRIIILIAAAATTFLGTSLAATERSVPDKIVGVATVTDGDTLRIGSVSVRLYGIDAPEAGQMCNANDGGKWPCGAIATGELIRLVEGRMLECNRAPHAHDPYGRMIAICRLDQIDVSAEMVDRGMAWSFRRYSHQYDDIEEKAKTRRVGIWQASCTQPPWEYRHNAWEEALRVAPEGKPIKGNFARRGQCIYHTPWSPFWRKINMHNPRIQWFATERDAIAAGCRAPRRMVGKNMSQDDIQAALSCSADTGERRP